MKKRLTVFYVWTALLLAIPFLFLYPVTFLTPNPAAAIRYLCALFGLVLTLAAAQYLPIDDRQRKLLDGITWALIILMATTTINVFVIWQTHDWQFAMMVLQPLLVLIAVWILSRHYSLSYSTRYAPMTLLGAVVAGAVFGWLFKLVNIPVLQGVPAGLYLYVILGAIASEFLYRYFVLRLAEGAFRGVMPLIYTAIIYALINLVYFNKLVGYYNGSLTAMTLYVLVVALFGFTANVLASNRIGKGNVICAIVFNSVAFIVTQLV